MTNTDNQCFIDFKNQYTKKHCINLYKQEPQNFKVALKNFDGSYSSLNIDNLPTPPTKHHRNDDQANQYYNAAHRYYNFAVDGAIILDSASEDDVIIDVI